MHDQKPKTINGLMKHLRAKGIAIKNSKQKRQLTNQGYFHGYKGYRFFATSNTKLPITDYEQINKTIIYDSNLKALFYGKIMYIETSLKNICLNVIMNSIGSSDLNIFYKKAVESYKNSPDSYNPKQKKEAQEGLMRLQTRIHSIISKAYSGEKPTITHFYNNTNYNGIPLWAVFENLTLGDFGSLINCLTFDLKDSISKRLKMDSPIDTSRKNICEYIFTLKDLRNAIAHNAVVYDNRFGKAQANSKSQRMKDYLKTKYHLQYVKFEDIIDYVVLISFFLEILGESRTDILAFIKNFKTLTDSYIASIGTDISKVTFNNNWSYRIDALIANFAKP